MALGNKPARPSGSGTSYPIARAFAFTVVLAVLVLLILRHLFGAIRVEVGTR